MPQWTVKLRAVELSQQFLMPTQLLPSSGESGRAGEGSGLVAPSLW